MNERIEDHFTIEQRLMIQGIWWNYGIYKSYNDAFDVIGFAKNQGYAAAKIKDLGNGNFSVDTMKMGNTKGAL